ncbi:hypothetical protein E4U50_007306 [Claviceps purpurea]|nr:hypothetical protein E4U50_007306 [Claviceps purpurea]
MIYMARKLTGQPLRFKYLDGDGLSAVIVVMSSKACSGQHLAGRAPDGDDRSRTEHLSHVIRTCMVHFGRNIDQAVGPTDTSKFAKRMHELATARDRDEYMAIIEGLMAQTERPKVARWAKHKRQGWVGPGVCQALSNMDPNDWKELRANTNAAEQSGGKSLSFLRDCVLAEGIRTSEVSDRRDMEHFQNRAWTGIAHKQANPSNWNLTYNALRREEADLDTLSEEGQGEMLPRTATLPLAEQFDLGLLEEMKSLGRMADPQVLVWQYFALPCSVHHMDPDKMHHALTARLVQVLLNAVLKFVTFPFIVY